MPASDVYSWAKAVTKPTYTASEVGALAATDKAADSDKWDGYHLNVVTTLPTTGTVGNIYFEVE
jgi:hypothetical protein